MKIKCLIVDDEQLARDMLEKFASQIPHLTIVGKYKNTHIAEQFLANQNVDLMLLDISMPGTSGIEFLKNIEKPPKVIFTTAFSNYAVEGFNLEAIDYLLKPIGFKRFSDAIEKVKLQIEIQEKAATFDKEINFKECFLIVKQGHHFQKIFLKDILFIESMREYIAYHSEEKMTMELKSITKLEQSLPTEYFIRTHRSYIVAKKAVKEIRKNLVILNSGKEIPIGKTYKQTVRKNLLNQNLI